MRKRIGGVSVIAVVCLLGAGDISTASARSVQGAVFRPAPAARGLILTPGRGVASPRIASTRPHDGISRRGEFGRGLPVLGWPYFPAFDAYPLSDSSAAPQPQVIVVSGGAGGAAADPRPQADYSFVAGCRAIPNGYHCDPPQHDDTAH